MLLIIEILYDLQHLYKRLDRKESLHCCSGSHMKCWRDYLKAFKYESSGQKIDEQSLHHCTLSESSLALEIGNNAKFILRWEFAGLLYILIPHIIFGSR